MSTNNAINAYVSPFMATVFDDADAPSARATLGVPALDGTGATGTWNVNILGNAATATAVGTIAVSNNSTYYPLFVASSTNSNQVCDLATGLTFNPSTNTMTTTTFVGALTGNATTATSATSATTATSATSATTATNATNTAITDDTTTNATMYPTWVTAATGNLPQKVSSTKMSFNPGTSTLFVPSLTISNTRSIQSIAGAGSFYLDIWDTSSNLYRTFMTATAQAVPLLEIIAPSGGDLNITASLLNSSDGDINAILGSTTRNNAQFRSPVNAQTGTTYAVLESDCGKIVTFNNAAAITVTLPQQSTTTTAAGFFFWYINLGAGTVTFVKEGAETLNGNSTSLTNSSGKIMRNTTTNWQSFGGSAVSNMFGMALDIGTITTSQTIVIKGYVGTTVTLLGINQKCRALTTAGTFAIQKNGVGLSGLTAIVPSTAGSYTTATGTGSDNVLVRGDQLTIVANGTLVGVLDLNIDLDITQTF